MSLPIVEKWLPGLDSNQGFQLQRLTCYHYTTGQNERTKVSNLPAEEQAIGSQGG
jgi:hypothetical protein